MRFFKKMTVLKRADILKRHRASIVDCKHCHGLYHVKFGVTMIKHLIDAHAIDSQHAKEIVHELYERFLEAKRKAAHE